MSRTIYNVGLAELLPQSFAGDIKISAICAAFDAMNAIVTAAIGKVIILANVGDQPSEVTDRLAVELQTPYYDQVLPLATRQALVAASGRINAKKGTKAAIKELAEIIFGPVDIREWFEYSGDPFHFVIYVSDENVPGAKLAAFTAMLEKVKPLRSTLDSIVIGIQGTIQYYGYRGKSINDLLAYTIDQLAAGINMD
jgi:P2-related tail formation protein